MLSILYGGEATDITKQSHMNHFESLWITIKLSQDFDTEIHLLFTLRTSSFLPTAHRFTCSLTTPCFPPFTAQPHTTWQWLLTYKLQHLHLSANYTAFSSSIFGHHFVHPPVASSLITLSTAVTPTIVGFLRIASLVGVYLGLIFMASTPLNRSLYLPSWAF